MRKRLVAGLLVLSAVTGGSMFAAPSLAGASDWVCVAEDTSDKGVCVGNPLPPGPPELPPLPGP